MACVEFCLGQRTCGCRRDAAGTHEIEAFGDPACEFLKPFGLRSSVKEFGHPAVNFRQIGKTTLRKGPKKVQGRGGLFINAKKALRIGNPLTSREPHSVDHVATVTRQFDPVYRLGRRGARLSKLPRHPADLDYGHGGSESQDNGHLENDLE